MKKKEENLYENSNQYPLPYSENKINQYNAIPPYPVMNNHFENGQKNY